MCFGTEGYCPQPGRMFEIMRDPATNGIKSDVVRGERTIFVLKLGKILGTDKKAVLDPGITDKVFEKICREKRMAVVIRNPRDSRITCLVHDRWFDKRRPTTLELVSSFSTTPIEVPVRCFPAHWGTYDNMCDSLKNRRRGTTTNVPESSDLASRKTTATKASESSISSKRRSTVINQRESSVLPKRKVTLKTDGAQSSLPPKGSKYAFKNEAGTAGGG